MRIVRIVAVLILVAGFAGGAAPAGAARRGPGRTTHGSHLETST